MPTINKPDSLADDLELAENEMIFRQDNNKPKTISSKTKTESKNEQSVMNLVNEIEPLEIENGSSADQFGKNCPGVLIVDDNIMNITAV